MKNVVFAENNGKIVAVKPRRTSRDPVRGQMSLMEDDTLADSARGYSRDNGSVNAI